MNSAQTLIRGGTEQATPWICDFFPFENYFLIYLGFFYTKTLLGGILPTSISICSPISYGIAMVRLKKGSKRSSYP